MAARYSANTSVLDWHKRLVCSHCGGREVDIGADGKPETYPRSADPAFRGCSGSRRRRAASIGVGDRGIPRLLASASAPKRWRLMPPFHLSTRQQLDHAAVSPSLQQAGQTDLRAAARNPLKRIGQPEEVAAVILGLATTMTFVNGTIIPVTCFKNPTG